MLRPLFEKIMKGERMSDAERAYFLDWADKAMVLVAPPAQSVTIIEQNITPLQSVIQAEMENMLRGRNWIPNLSTVSNQLGLQIAGEFRTGNGKAPGDGFTGGRFGYPGFTYGGVEYFFVGVSNDTLQVGLSLADGKIYAGAGGVVLSSTGITATAGTIGGWVLGSDSIKDAAGLVGMLSTVTGGDDIRFFAGNATPASAPFRVTEAGALVASNATITGSITATTGTIGGWSISAFALYKFSTGSTGIILGGSDSTVRVGDTAGNHIVLDGANQRIRSSNFVSGASGFSIAADTGDAEFNNIIARGMIKTAVFQKDTISSVGGSVLVLDSDTLSSDMTAADSSTLTISGNTTFAVNDILRMKGGGDDEWLQVTNAASAPTYTVTRDKAAAYAANSNPAWKKGQAVVKYGASGDGGVEIASGSNPSVRVFDHAGSPWSTLREIIKLDENGITFDNQADILRFKDVNGVYSGTVGAVIYRSTDDGMYIINGKAGKSIISAIRLTDASIPYTRLFEDPNIANTVLLQINAGNTAAELALGGPGDGFSNGILLWANKDGKETVFNDTSYDIDFRIEGATDTNLFKLDAGLDGIGIGGAAESGYKLKVSGKVNLTTGNTYDINGSPHTHSGIGGLVLIEQYTASSSAALTFTGISSTYDDYVIEIIELVPATNNVTLSIQLSSNGGSSWETSNNYYSAAGYVANDGSTGTFNSNPATSFTLGKNINSTATDRTYQATLHLSSLASTTHSKSFHGTLAYSNQTFVIGGSINGLLNVAGTAYNAFKIFFSSGNIASGIVRLYGLQK